MVKSGPKNVEKWAKELVQIWWKSSRKFTKFVDFISFENFVKFGFFPRLRPSCKICKFNILIKN